MLTRHHVLFQFADASTQTEDVVTKNVEKQVGVGPVVPSMKVSFDDSSCGGGGGGGGGATAGLENEEYGGPGGLPTPLNLRRRTEPILPQAGATMGLIFGVRNQMEMLNTRIGRPDDGDEGAKGGNKGGGPDFTSISGPFMSFLGEDKRRRVTQMTAYSRTVSAGERCFFVLLLLVTFIYAVGIITAVVLLSCIMFFT